MLGGLRLGQLSHGTEQLLQPGRRDELEAGGRFVAGVPECVPLAARLEEQVAGLGDNLLPFQNRSDPTGKDEGVFVLVVVAVHRRSQRPRCEVFFIHYEPRLRDNEHRIQVVKPLRGGPALPSPDPTQQVGVLSLVRPYDDDARSAAGESSA